MVVKATRILPALLVLLVLFGNQAAYAAGSSKTQNGHCAGSAPQPEQPCPLPLWLTCCDDRAAVPVGASPIAPNGALLLPLETALVTAPPAPGARLAARVDVPPDTPSRLSSVLRI
jgi:hypothetical protein